MTAFVIDVSTTIAWLFEEQGHPAGVPERLGEAALVAPWLWRVEMVNAILMQERKQRITAAQGARALQILDALDVEIVAEPAQRSLESLALFARAHQLTAYDAVYLELAIHLGLPLSTPDRDLQRAAKQAGVTLWGED